MKKLFALAALAIGMASCSQEMENAATDSQQEIKLTTKITPATRGVNIDEQSTMIKPGQQVGVTITGASASHQNVIWVAGEDGSLENQGNPIFYSDNTATITAYQPYNASWTDVASGTAYNFDISTDQSGAGYSQSDLLYTTTTAQKTTESVNLTFKHVLAKITVILNNTNGESLDDAEIKIINTATNVSFSNGTAAVASSEVNDILAGTGAQAAAIIAPQSVDGGTRIIQVVWNGKTFCYSLPTTKEFHAGYAYTYRLRINNSPELNLDGSDVEDWNGEENEGEMGEVDLTPYVTFTADAEQTFKLTTEVNTLEYSVDGGSWATLGSNVVTFGGTNGSLRLRGQSATGTTPSSTTDNSVLFGNSTPVSCTGDIRTLVDYTCYETAFTGNARFGGLFAGCTQLISAPKLPSTQLNSDCYSRMFKGCTSLTEAPALPAVELDSSCYAAMFFGCSSLLSAPNLPAENLPNSSYAFMFYDCSSIETAPVISAKTVGESSCDRMFYQCSSLKNAPALNATTVAKNGYYAMFEKCTSLIKAPELPATSLTDYSYSDMFFGCTALVEAPSILPATTLGEGTYQRMFTGCSALKKAPEIPNVTNLGNACFFMMFKNCTHLNYIKIMVDNMSATQYANCCDYAYSSNFWLNNVSGSGIFVRNYSSTWYSGSMETTGCPQGWTLLYYNESADTYYLSDRLTVCDENGNVL